MRSLCAAVPSGEALNRQWRYCDRHFPRWLGLHVHEEGGAALKELQFAKRFRIAWYLAEKFPKFIFAQVAITCKLLDVGRAGSLEGKAMGARSKV